MKDNAISIYKLDLSIPDTQGSKVFLYDLKFNSEETNNIYH